MHFHSLTRSSCWQITAHTRGERKTGREARCICTSSPFPATAAPNIMGLSLFVLHCWFPGCSVASVHSLWYSLLMICMALSMEGPFSLAVVSWAALLLLFLTISQCPTHKVRASEELSYPLRQRATKCTTTDVCLKRADMRCTAEAAETSTGLSNSLS